MIKKVKNFLVEDIVEYEGERCKIVGFPTRYSVVLENINPKLGSFTTAKVSIKHIKK